MNRTREAAFFDFDRTVLDGDAGVMFGRELVRLRRKRLREEKRGTVGWAARNVAYEARLARLLAQSAFLRFGVQLRVVKRSGLLRTAYRALKGFHYLDLKLLAGDFFEEVLAEQLFPDARTEMERHRAQGRRVVVVTTGMHLLIDPVKRHLPVDDVIGVNLVSERGILTGEVVGPLWGQEKADAVRAYARARDVNLPRSFAYTDHVSDLKLLQLVGHPTAVNPELRLRLQARARRWPIVRWKRTPR